MSVSNKQTDIKGAEVIWLGGGGMKGVGCLPK